MTDLSSTQIYYETRELCHKDVYQHLASLRKSLLELKSRKTLLENSLFWKNEIERTKQEKDKEWLEKINSAEAENKRLQAIIQNLTKLEGPKMTDIRQLWEAENEIDKLNRQLDDKTIHINRLQISLAEMTKRMYTLEKSWALLCFEYRKLKSREHCKLRKLEPPSETEKNKLHVPS